MRNQPVKYSSRVQQANAIQFMYACMYVCVCIYTFLYELYVSVCMSACMLVCIWMYVCLYVWMDDACMYMFVWMYVWMDAFTHETAARLFTVEILFVKQHQNTGKPLEMTFISPSFIISSLLVS